MEERRRCDGKWHYAGGELQELGLRIEGNAKQVGRELDAGMKVEMK